MTARPSPHPVVAVEEVARELLSRRTLEDMLMRSSVGRRMVDQARRMGPSSSPSEVDVSGENTQPASWFDLGVSHPAAVLGVLLLSRPEMPLAVFLRAAAVARGAAVAPAAAVGLKKLADGASELDEAEPVSEGVEGGRVWGHGHLVAVGAGDAGRGGSWQLFVPAWEVREDDSRPGFAPVEGEGGVRAASGNRGSVIRRLGVLAKLFRAKSEGLVSPASEMNHDDCNVQPAGSGLNCKGDLALPVMVCCCPFVACMHCPCSCLVPNGGLRSTERLQAESVLLM
jgi:hypothetical protein